MKSGVWSRSAGSVSVSVIISALLSWAGSGGLCHWLDGPLVGLDMVKELLLIQPLGWVYSALKQSHALPG